MHEADDVYMRYAGKEELTAILTELLEVERAGVRVTHQSALIARDGPLGELMRAIEKDEARWCAMLAGHLRAAVLQIRASQPPAGTLKSDPSTGWVQLFSLSTLSFAGGLHQSLSEKMGQARQRYCRRLALS